MLMVLLLRGPQTVGELRGRAERAHPFESLEEVESTLAALAETGYVLRLPRQPGRKECRYAQLLSGEPVVEEYAARPEAATLRVREEDDRLAALTQEVAELRAELDRLREEFARFKAQFE